MYSSDYKTGDVILNICLTVIIALGITDLNLCLVVFILK